MYAGPSGIHPPSRDPPPCVAGPRPSVMNVPYPWPTGPAPRAHPASARPRRGRGRAPADRIAPRRPTRQGDDAFGHSGARWSRQSPELASRLPHGRDACDNYVLRFVSVKATDTTRNGDSGARGGGAGRGQSFAAPPRSLAPEGPHRDRALTAVMSQLGQRVLLNAITRGAARFPCGIGLLGPVNRTWRRSQVRPGRRRGARPGRVPARMRRSRVGLAADLEAVARTLSSRAPARALREGADRVGLDRPLPPSTGASLG